MNLHEKYYEKNEKNDTIRYDTIRYDTMRCDTIRYDTIRDDTKRTIYFETPSWKISICFLKEKLKLSMIITNPCKSFNRDLCSP